MNAKTAFKEAQSASLPPGPIPALPKYKKGLSIHLAEFTVWSGKLGMISGAGYFLGTTPTVTRLLAILEKQL